MIVKQRKYKNKLLSFLKRKGTLNWRSFQCIDGYVKFVLYIMKLKKLNA